MNEVRKFFFVQHTITTRICQFPATLIVSNFSCFIFHTEIIIYVDDQFTDLVNTRSS